MRIIAGKFKGRTLVTLPDRTVRPTTDRVKEAMFNLVQGEVGDACVLDLFAGSGALGVEALSRGAREVVFVDASSRSLDVVKQNLQKAGGAYRLIHHDFRAALSKLHNEGKRFDLIFLDPPYRSGWEGEIMRAIAEGDLLCPQGAIVLERARGDAPYPMPAGYARTIVRDYGATTLEVVRPARVAAVTGVFDPFTNGHMFLVEQALQRADYVFVALLCNPEKTPMFSTEKRVAWIERATAHFKGRVRVVASDDWAYACCRAMGVQFVVRGVRNAADRAYEEDMAAFNREKGLETVLVQAEVDISSTTVKQKLLAGEPIDGLVPDAIQKDLTKEVKKWKT